MANFIFNFQESSFGLTKKQLFEFDLQGYVILKRFLSLEKVDYMNKVIDQAHKGELYLKYSFLGLDPIFMDILSDPRVMAICEELLGKWFRVDNVFAVERSPEAHNIIEDENLHSGPFANQGSFFYSWKDGRPRCGHIEFAYAMDKVEEGDGGLVLIPGSHKLNLPFEGKEVYGDILNGNFDQSYVHNPALDPGDLLIFSEATIHGTRKWLPKDRRRRNLYYKYCPGFMAWKNYDDIKQYLPLARNKIEKNLLRPPYVGSYDEKSKPAIIVNWRTPTKE